MNEENVQCVCCREDIKKGAIKCTKCDTFQDWRRFVSMSNLTLGLLIALIANVTTLVQFVGSHTKKTIEIQAKKVKIESGYIQVAFSNTGNTVAIVRGGTLRVKRNNVLDKTYPMQLYAASRNQIDPIIEPNKGKLLELQPIWSTSNIVFPPKNTDDLTCKYEIEFEIVGFTKNPNIVPLQSEDCLENTQ